MEERCSESNVNSNSETHVSISELGTRVGQNYVVNLMETSVPIFAQREEFCTRVSYNCIVKQI